MRERASRRASKPSGAGSLASTATSGGSSAFRLRTRRRLALVARHLPARVHAAVGSAGHREPHLPAQDGRERVLERLLHRPDPGLAGPATEVRAVVLEQQAGGHPRLRATISAYSF